jgi:hypothetical protein
MSPQVPGLFYASNCRPALFGGKYLNTSPPRKCSDGSIMEQKWSSTRIFPLHRILRCQRGEQFLVIYIWKVYSFTSRSTQASKILFVASGSVALCQQQVYRAATRRLICLHKTRPRVFGALGSNTGASVPPLSSSRRVLPCIPAARVDEFDQNLNYRHVFCSSNAFPPRYAHTVLSRRPVDRLLLL